MKQKVYIWKQGDPLFKFVVVQMLLLSTDYYDTLTILQKWEVKTKSSEYHNKAKVTFIPFANV